MLRRNTEIHHYFFLAAWFYFLAPVCRGTLAGKNRDLKAEKAKALRKAPFPPLVVAVAAKNRTAHCFICLSVLIPVRPECRSPHGSTSQSGLLEIPTKN